jgi:hypothetical protein
MYQNLKLESNIVASIVMERQIRTDRRKISLRNISKEARSITKLHTIVQGSAIKLR